MPAVAVAVQHAGLDLGEAIHLRGLGIGPRRWQLALGAVSDDLLRRTMKPIETRGLCPRNSILRILSVVRAEADCKSFTKQKLTE